MGFIQGDERILHIKQGINWLRVAFLTSNSMTTESEFINTTTRENDGFSTEIPQRQSTSIDFSAIMADDDSVLGKMGYKVLQELKRNRQLFEFKLEALNRNFTDYGRGYISSLSETAEAGSLMTFDGSINVYGKPLSEDDIIPPTQPILTVDQLLPLTQSAALSWTASTDNLAVSGYEFRISETGSSQIRILGNVTSYLLSGLEYAKNYGVNVRAFDLAGNYSPWSPKRNINIPVPSGQTLPEYMLFEDGSTMLDETGNPLEFE